MNAPRRSRLIPFCIMFSYLFPYGYSLQAENEIGFLETFALAPKRAEALAELIPGTEDHYYYAALLAQQEGRFDEVSGLLEPWEKRFGKSERWQEISRRQALLTYTKDPARTMAFLRDELGLSFTDKQEIPGEAALLPTSLQADQISWTAFWEEAQRTSGLGQISDAGLDRLIRDQVPLDDLRRTELLRRLAYPDYDRLVGLIAADLRRKDSRGFGEFAIHTSLTQAQLTELSGLLPELAENETFVSAMLARKRPADGVDFAGDPAAWEAHLNELWAFVGPLSPVFNSLKAAVLYRRLEVARRLGNYPADLFLEYVRLPRQADYMEPKYLQDRERQAHPVDLQADFSASSLLQPIGNDEPLVRDYLSHLFVEEPGITRFSPFIRETYLKRLFAETKLLAGLGNAEEWLALLGPGQIDEIKNRVELRFLASNREQFKIADEVSLSVDVKNIRELLVRVYEINALNFYLDRREEINTDLDLDGFAPNEEKRYAYDAAPTRRHTETFSFASLQGKAGIWVIEFIGNGISSRALVRKGRLTHLSQTTPAGELLVVLNEEQSPVAKASAWFGGKRYDTTDKGHILLPFSEAGNVPIVLSDGSSASLANVTLPREAYELSAGVLLSEESLLAGSEAPMAIRPTLLMAGRPVPLSLIEEATLAITTVDLDGVESRTETRDLELHDDRELIHRFRVPNRLQVLRLTLSGKIPSLTKPGEKIAVETSWERPVNGTDQNPQVSDAYFTRTKDGYFIEQLGKTGEPRSQRPTTLEFHHRDFGVVLIHELMSDPTGRIALGHLEGIQSIRATGEFGERVWSPSTAFNDLSSTIHAVAGEEILLPIPGLGEKLEHSQLALFEMRRGTIVRDVFAAAKASPGAAVISGLEPGDYLAVLRDSGQTVAVRVTDRAAPDQFGYHLGKHRNLERSPGRPLYLASVAEAGDAVKITVAHAGPLSRVHVVATRFQPDHRFANDFGPAVNPALYQIALGSNLTRYISGRDIGDEYRYILDRRAAKKYPGNSLTRPGLLLNPWELSETVTEINEASAGEAYKKTQPQTMTARQAPSPGLGGGFGFGNQDGVIPGNSPAYHFLKQGAVVLSNLPVAEDGTVTIKLADLGDRQHLQIMASNGTDVAYQDWVRPAAEASSEFRDLRLTQSLDPEKHYTQRRKVTYLDSGESLAVADRRSTQLQTYDTLGGIHATQVAINPNADLIEFSFVTRWPELDEKAKREKYSKYACHELHFFLSRKDPEFFAQVVAPYLINKKDKTFFDHYLLSDDLSNYLAPWEYERLNVVEKILLARRIGGAEVASTARHIRERFELLPRDPTKSAFWFQQALNGRASDLVMNQSSGADHFADSFSGDAFAAPAPMAVAAPAAPPADKPIFSSRGIVKSMVAEASPVDQGMSEEEAKAALGLLLKEGQAETLYQALDSTKEYAENNYYHLPIAEQTETLIPENAFWKDYANWDGKGAFTSREFPAATNTFAEMMLALSVLDLPFRAEAPEFTPQENSLTLTAKSPLLVFHQEIEEAPVAKEETPILVSQNLFRVDDRYRYVDGQQVDHFVDDELIAGVVYGSQVVVTNPTTSAHLIDILVQVPEGAIPLGGGDYRKTHSRELASFSTEQVEVLFYFPEVSPKAGFRLYPVQVAKNEEIIASAEPRVLTVLTKPSQVDEQSWEILSQTGSDEAVLEYLKVNNPFVIDLGRIAWRVRADAKFFERATALLASRHVYDDKLWSYGIHHQQLAATREYLKHADDFLASLGGPLQCELVSLDTVDRHWYEHLEYAPLVNARAHRLGKEHKILNDRFLEQYSAFLEQVSYQTTLDGETSLSVAAYLLLQDRIDEGLAWLNKLDPAALSTRLQYDYLKAYAALYEGGLDEAKVLVAKYESYPVDRWQQRFAAVGEQLKEIAGDAAKPTPEGGREGQMEQLTSKDRLFDLTAVGREAKVIARNLPEVTVNYYEMDLEFLFSSKPFVSGASGQFSYLKPNLREIRPIPAEAGFLQFAMPEQFNNKNVLVEVTAGGKSQAVAIYANSLQVQLSSNFGRLEVRREGNGEPLPRSYVKVYARMKDGSVRFFKDGYTDLRGKFDYVSLSTNEIEQVEAFSLLVMNEECGSLVRETAPPQR